MISLPVDERAVQGRMRAWHHLPVHACVFIRGWVSQIYGLSLSLSLSPSLPKVIPLPPSPLHPPPPIRERVACSQVAWQVLEAVQPPHEAAPGGVVLGRRQGRRGGESYPGRGEGGREGGQDDARTCRVVMAVFPCMNPKAEDRDPPPTI